ncbi:hypothetical protein [Alsobacter sp. R-9]
MRVLLALVAACLVQLTSWTAAAQADHWRYCLGIDRTETKVFFSLVFPSGADLDVLERAYMRWLIDQRLPVLRVSCPRADTRDLAESAEARAASYNLGEKRTPIWVEWPRTNANVTFPF